MPRMRLRRPSPALVISLIALFVALGGSSYAAIKVGSKQIVNNSVTSGDVKNKTLSDGDIKRNALGGGAINESKLGKVPSAAKADSAATASTASSASRATTAGSATTASRATTATTATTATNASQLGGVAAGTYLRGLEQRNSPTAIPSSTSPRTASIDCLNGKKAVGGGGSIGSNPGSIALTDSRPTDSGDGWTVSASETGAVSDDWTLFVWVVCADG